MSKEKADEGGRRPRSTRIRLLDRYIPGWPRNGCANCDGMGFYPTNDLQEIAAAVLLAKPGDVFKLDHDGYANLRCQTCGGTGRIPGTAPSGATKAVSGGS